MKPSPSSSLLWRTLFVLIALTVAVAPLLAATPDDELWLPTAGHGPGAEGSFWVTDVYIFNPNEDAVLVNIAFLERGVDNSAVEGESFEIEGGSLLVLEDIVGDLSDEESVFGALHVEITEEEDEEEGEATLIWLQEDEGAEDFFEGDTPVMVYARIYDQGGDGTKGQAMEGFTSQSAIMAGGSLPATRVIGVTQNSMFRTNWFGVNVSQNEDEEPVAAEVMVELLDASGESVGAMSYTIPPRAPIFGAVSDLTSGIDDGILKFTMMSGSAIFGASKVDNITNDGTTLEPFWKSIDPGSLEFTDTFNMSVCTWQTTGTNPYFPLTPGLRLVLEAEDEEEGETEESIFEVTTETMMVNGIMTRVVTETESVNDELVEISRNFFASCAETGDVYYFGEEVDIYEDGEIVSHDGAWQAGENDARAGVFMPGGTPIIGARYFQEIAPGVALDRAEHLAVGQTIETPAGTFENCLIVLDSNAIEPAASGDPKAYCFGIGIVRDEDLELVEMSIPN